MTSVLEDAKRLAELATVRITALEGQGVVVPGQLVLTAAHCIDWTTDAAMALGDPFAVDIRINGKQLKAHPLAVEPVSDIAILGEMDDQCFPEDANLYQEMIATICPIPVSTREPELFKEFPIHIFSHKKKWITGKAQLCADGSQILSIATAEPIEGGTSGGPVLSDEGELVGIVSIAADPSEFDECESFEGHVPRPHLALPVWLVKTITSCVRES